jgi:tetratricopeptide (TPR) repeat protein
MIMPTGPPSLALLTPSQRDIVEETLNKLRSLQFDKRAIDPIKDKLAARFADAIKTKDDVDRMTSELELWVCWRRTEAYWLTFLFQEAASIRSIFSVLDLPQRKIKAALLYSDAQANFNDDLAMSSLEVAYNNLVCLQHIIGDDYAELEERIRKRLLLYHDFYSRWCRPFDPAECAPIREHLYSCKSYSELVLAFAPQLEGKFLLESGAPARVFSERIGAVKSTAPIEMIYGLKDVINSSDGSGDIYHSVVARRFLGQLYQDAGWLNEALDQFEIALIIATASDLDTEVGHLYRCIGDVFHEMGKPLEACKNFRPAVLHEEKAFPYSVYWLALTFRMWGDARKSWARTTTTTEKTLEVLRLASDAYEHGLDYFDVHLASSSLLPISLGVKQQMFRQFSERSISVAECLNDQKGIVAEIEASGPREATEIVVEILAAQELKAGSVDDYRKERETFHRYLTTVPTKFEDYLESLSDVQNLIKRAYMRRRISLTKPITYSFESHKVAEQVLSLRIQATAFLLFNVGWNSSEVVLVDMGTGEVRCKDVSSLRAKDLMLIHQQYNQNYLMASDALDPAAIMTPALDKLLEEYEGMFEGSIEELLSSSEYKEVKVFPCLQMNAFPFQAMKYGRGRLVDAFNISYCPTIGLFLKLHERTFEASPRLTMIYDPEIKSFQGLVNQLVELYNGRVSVEQRPTWQDFLTSISSSQAGDLLFACHGHYSAENPADSRLRIDGNEGASFSQIFSDLDLRSCRSVVLGACESGLARTQVASEYLGLPVAFLSAGVSRVIGSLWEVNRWATSILLGRYFELLNSGTLTVTDSLNKAQRDLASMDKDNVVKWLQKYCPECANALESQIRKMGDCPFSHPYYWAGFYVSGDF